MGAGGVLGRGVMVVGGLVVSSWKLSDFSDLFWGLSVGVSWLFLLLVPVGSLCCG